jgi:hypothetical protein
MLWTLGETLIEVKSEPPDVVEFPMHVTLSGILYAPFLPLGYRNIFVFVLLNSIPSMEQKLGLSLSTTIEVKPVQPEKVNTQMLVTLLGIVIEVKPVQSEKAKLQMLVTPSGTAYPPLNSFGQRIKVLRSSENSTPYLSKYAIVSISYYI